MKTYSQLLFVILISAFVLSSCGGKTKMNPQGDAKLVCDCSTELWAIQEGIINQSDSLPIESLDPTSYEKRIADLNDCMGMDARALNEKEKKISGLAPTEQLKYQELFKEAILKDCPDLKPVLGL